MGLDRKEFGRTLSLERKRLKLSVSQIAEFCGVKAGAQYLYEKGNRLPNADYIDRAISIGVNPEILLPSLRNREMYSLETIVDVIKQVDSELLETRVSIVKNLLTDNPQKNVANG
tara:strand:+ start:610 stop:954 length:345 start_codon:yes stop_codon:yes gene_type:complete